MTTDTLGANTFYLANSHANAASKVYGAKGYEKRRRSMDEFLGGLRMKLKGKPLADPDVSAAWNAIATAQGALDQFSAACYDALRLLASADADYKAKGAPSMWLIQRDSKAAPAGIDPESWNLAWYVNLNALSNLMPRLEDLAARADTLSDLAASAVLKLEGKTWVTAPPTPRIDWSKSDEITLTPEARAAGAKVAETVEKTARLGVAVGLGGLAIVAVIAVAGLLLWKGGRRG